MVAFLLHCMLLCYEVLIGLNFVLIGTNSDIGVLFLWRGSNSLMSGCRIIIDLTCAHIYHASLIELVSVNG